MRTAPIISGIVAMSANRVIGRGNQMPWHLPDDLKHFKLVTMGKPVIMGRKTFESIGRPLPGRSNIVISRAFTAPGIEVVPDLTQAINAACAHLNDQQMEIIIMGGGQIYTAALPLLDRIYLTQIQQTIEDGDTFFPALDPAEWQEKTRDDRFDANGAGFSFLMLERIRKQVSAHPAYGSADDRANQ